jgi:hypothetical protein
MNGILKQVNMKKQINYTVKIFLCLLISAQAFSQTETFDIATYTPPKDFKKDSKPGVVNFTNVNAATGGFCVIAMFASTTSTGDAEKDFEREWHTLVVAPYKAEANPKTETQTNAEGWEVVTAAAPVKLDGIDIYVILTVASGFGKTMSIRTFLNDESYTAQIDAMFANMELDKTKTTTVSNNNTFPAQTTGSGTGKFGLMNYNAPAGWSHQIFSDGVVFKPLGLPADEHLVIQIMQPISFSGNLEQALQQSFDEAATMYNGTKMNYIGEGNYKKDQAQQSFRGWEYIRCNGGVRIGSGDYPPEFGLDLFVIKINNRFERIAVLKSRKINRSCSMSSFYADDRQQYKNAIDGLLFSIHFDDGGEASLQPGTTDGGGVIGVWQGISMQTSATSGIRYNVFSPIFLSNGQAYFGAKFWSEGLDGLDTRIPPEINRRDWGTYTFKNGRGILKMPYANIPLRIEGNTLIITANQTDHKFYNLPSVDGARFNGTYVMSEAYGKIPAITFTADGRFTDNGAIRVLYHDYNDCINPALTPGSGTYVVKDYSITFNYADGRKIKIAFLGTEYDIKNQGPAVLRMSSNEDPMTRR